MLHTNFGQFDFTFPYFKRTKYPKTGLRAGYCVILKGSEFFIAQIICRLPSSKTDVCYYYEGKIFKSSKEYRIIAEYEVVNYITPRDRKKVCQYCPARFECYTD